MDKNPSTLISECAACEAAVAAEVIASYGHFDPETDSMPQRTSLVKCPRCGNPMVVAEDYIGSRGNIEHYDAPYRLFPPRERRLLRGPVPKAVRDAVSEADRCLRARAHTAAAIMCRKAIEGVCADQGHTKGNLYKRLEALRDDGTLDPRLYEWADELRNVGNQAAHDVHADVSREDARDLLDLAEAIADYLYTFRARFESFRARRSTEE